MKKIIYFFFFLTVLVGCKDNYKNLEDGLYADISTSKGNIILKLYPEEVPLTVANFVTLAEGTNPEVSDSLKGKKYYNGLTFHRVVPDFIIQSGDPLANSQGGPGYRFYDEFNPNLRHNSAGTLSMANSGFNTNGSQFFITHKPTPWLDAYGLNGGGPKDCSKPNVNCHAVFGKVITGQNVVDSIAKNDRIRTIKIVRKGEEAKSFDAPEVFKEEFAKGPEKEKQRLAAIAKAEEDRYNKFVADKAIFEAKKDVDKAKSTDSGLKIITYKKGKGKKFNRSVPVSIAYSVYMADGTHIQTKEVSNPYIFTMDKSPMIAGVTEAILQMREGGKKRLFIPYYLAYGEQAGRLPAKTDLIFELELIKVGK